MTVDDPRALTPTESSVLDLLLGVEFPGVDELRVQAESAAVVGGCDCGCPSIALEVPEDARADGGLVRSACTRSRYPFTSFDDTDSS